MSLAPDADEVAFELPRTIVAGHQHDERSRRLVGARVLASDLVGESRKDPALAFPVSAQTGAPSLRADSTGKHVDKNVARCRRTVQNRRPAGFIVDDEGRERAVHVGRSLERDERYRGLDPLRVIGRKQ
jgi:hypothetical protein